MKKDITKEQAELVSQYISEHMEEILARITTPKNEVCESVSECNTQGGTQLSFIDESGERNTSVEVKKKRRHRPKYKRLGERKLRIHNGVRDNSGTRHYRLTFNSVISKAILENNLKFVSIQRELSTDALYLWATEKDLSLNGVRFNSNGKNLTIDNKQLILRIMGDLGIHRKIQKCDLSIFWSTGHIAVSECRLLLGVIDKDGENEDEDNENTEGE